ncbi:hypothetical protein QTO34_004030 [Cnephaeus nilssonii]|uniref:Uncharacterized protein n=1 Tax=Cnephaeus nilssonii TaxID=3371016 RepID=A0AA40LJX7_CNENI|nr:hypothetical protein QTO34_004030 [Eptesicus nilssonii]
MMDLRYRQRDLEGAVEANTKGGPVAEEQGKIEKEGRRHQVLTGHAEEKLKWTNEEIAQAPARPKGRPWPSSSPPTLLLPCTDGAGSTRTADGAVRLGPVPAVGASGAGTVSGCEW